MRQVEGRNFSWRLGVVSWEQRQADVFGIEVTLVYIVRSYLKQQQKWIKAEMYKVIDSFNIENLDSPPLQGA